MEEHTKKEKGTITLKKTTLWQLATLLFAVLFIISLFTGGFGIDNDNINDGSDVPADNVAGPNAQGLIESNDPISGDANAGISVVEFSDFQCPYCANAAFGTVADLKLSDLYKNGDVNFIYKHFPLNSIHPFAQKAAEAAECANRQDMFYEYHDKLFEHQNALDVTSLKTYAGQVGLNMAEFNSCLDGDEAKDEVDKELQQGVAAGGKGTPYFVIVNNDNGKTVAVSGAVPYAQLEAAINSIQ